MALQFINKEFDYNPNTRVTRFFALDQRRTVRFAISRDALLKLEGRRDMPDGALSKVFDRHRAHIHAIAGNIVRIPGTGQMMDYAITTNEIGIVTRQDFLRKH